MRCQENAKSVFRLLPPAPCGLAYCWKEAIGLGGETNTENKVRLSLNSAFSSAVLLDGCSAGESVLGACVAKISCRRAINPLCSTGRTEHGARCGLRFREKDGLKGGMDLKKSAGFF